MYSKNFEKAYAALAKLWDDYPDIKDRFIQTNGEDEENLDLFICNHYSELSDAMDNVFTRYYHKVKDDYYEDDYYDVPGDENMEFYNRYFGFFYYQDIFE